MRASPVAVRWREDTGWEFRCEDCSARARAGSFWPLDFDFWDPRAGMQRCRACWAAHVRRRRLERDLAQPGYSQRWQRRYYRENRAQILRTKRAYYYAHRDAINAKRRARYQASKQLERAA